MALGLLSCGAQAPSSIAPSAATRAAPRSALSFAWRRQPKTEAAPEPLVSVLADELARSQQQLKQQQEQPYYLAYQVIERDSVAIEARHGALYSSLRIPTRTLDVEMHLGSTELDNSHRLPGEVQGSTFRGAHDLPLEDNDAALKNALWLATDAEYQSARSALFGARAAAQVELPKARPVADFSLEPPRQHFEQRLPLELDRELWQRALTELSAVAREFREVLDSTVSLTAASELRTLVNSEGSQQQLAQRRVRLEMTAETTASDGMHLSRSRIVDARSLSRLPPLIELKRMFAHTFRDVLALARAEPIEPYVGPALLEGRAAGVFFHEVLGHRMEGHRQHNEQEGQTFTDMLGQQLLPPLLDVYDDPTLSALEQTDLNGHYLFDDEGVPAERATLVEGGVLRGFLLSRAPVVGFDRSNGHGRRQPGHGVVARQANLVVQPRSGSTDAELHQALVREVRRQGLPFGLRFEEIVGGYTQTGRQDTQAFKVMPVMVYRVFPDGSEQLVRGVDIEGTPLSALSRIVEVGSELAVFNGLCGAESGWVPVSAISPGVLVSQIEVARQESANEKLPLLAPPDVKVPPSPSSPGIKEGDGMRFTP